MIGAHAVLNTRRRSGAPGLARPLLALLALVLSGCAALGRPSESWTEVELEVASTKVLHEVITLSLDDLRYPMGIESAPGEWQVVTLWKESRHPFQGKGWRARAHVEYESLGLGRHKVRVRVERETNESHRPLDAAHDKWVLSADDGGAANAIVAKIRAYLHTS